LKIVQSSCHITLHFCAKPFFIWREKQGYLLDFHYASHTSYYFGGIHQKREEY